MTQARAKKEKADVFTMPTMEVPAAMREAAEKSVTQAKQAYDKFKVAAEGATDAIEDTFESAREGFVSVNVKAVEMMQVNTDSLFGFAKKFLGVKTFADAVELQSSFARECFETYTAQAKEMQELFSKVASETSEPTKAVVEKAMKEFKAA